MQVKVIWYSGCGGRTYFGLCDEGSDTASVSGFGVLTVEWKRLEGRDWSWRMGSGSGSCGDGWIREAKRCVLWERRRVEVDSRRNAVKGVRGGGILDGVVIS